MLLALGALAAVVLYVIWWNLTLVTIDHAAERYARRANTLSANVTGWLFRYGTRLSYRLNDGAWTEVRQARKRTTPPDFTIEMLQEELRPGANSLEMRAEGWLRPDQELALTFVYDPAPVELPVEVRWSEESDLESQDGAWEVIRDSEGTGWVRPVPGREAYDRLLTVTGAFAGGRRVSTDIIFRAPPARKVGWGFGILPMWAGHPEDEGVRPRRGWRFSLAWYYSHYNAVGQEFSEKMGGDEPLWIASYRNFTLAPDERYRVVAEAWPEMDAQGRHVRYRQRMKWWRADEPESDEWLEIADTPGAPIPEGEYGVALVTLWSAVEFGPVTVEPMDGPPD